MIVWLPYCGTAPDTGNWLLRWNFDPLVMTALALAAGAVIVRRRDLRVRPACGALSLTAFLYISPFCALGSALFTVRIVHDVMLAALLAPLIVYAVRLNDWRIPGTLPAWTAIHAVIFWFWHAPPAYAAAMSSDVAFWAMQVTLTATAVAWWAKVGSAPAPSAALSLLATMVAMGTLGALLTFAPRAFYAPHWLTTQPWGLSPLEDQQLAGILMWAPASLIYLIAALSILYRSLGRRAAA
jgi:putative membrane protein